MATKAEKFKARMQRSGRRQPISPKLERAMKKAGARSSARVRQARPRANAMPNLSPRAGRKAEVVLEASQGRPSRKSTRRSANKGKIATNLERRQMRRATSPQSRAARAAAKASG